ncbi:MAG: DUF2461 domain-containing protein [Dysgonamonadaceae bacterium]|jgi:uncharacterized protein (TIGR02453 family)|nr:DUF2461 domain-containing protein [Dysgonamonadaceae bacterium]
MKQPTEPFRGFTPTTFQFFNELKEYNYKPWFDEHKPVYEAEIVRPLKALAHILSPAMYAIDPMIETNPNKVVSRIYRDIRFSKDKTPYRTAMWISFQRISTNWQNFPCYYLGISDSGYSYGMGLYLPERKKMDALRSRIEYEPKYFRKMTTSLIGKYAFSIGGEAYKRTINSSLPEYFQQWIQRKSIYLYKRFPVGAELFTTDFATSLTNEYILLQPLYNYLIETCFNY